MFATVTLGYYQSVLTSNEMYARMSTHTARDPACVYVKMYPLKSFFAYVYATVSLCAWVYIPAWCQIDPAFGRAVSTTWSPSKLMENWLCGSCCNYNVADESNSGRESSVRICLIWLRCHCHVSTKLFCLLKVTSFPGSLYIGDPLCYLAHTYCWFPQRSNVK